MAAIAGGVVAGVVVLAVLGILLCCLRHRQLSRSPAASAERRETPFVTPMSFGIQTAFAPAAMVQTDAQALPERFNQLADRMQPFGVGRLDVRSPDMRSSVASDNTATSSGPARSISMLKRDQTSAVMSHQRGYSGYALRDSLVHTGSGFRLTAEAVDEVPPTYQAH